MTITRLSSGGKPIRQDAMAEDRVAMRRLPSLDLVRRELRAKACSRCPHHPPAAAGAGAPWAACEAACPIFIFLPALVALAERLDPIVSDRAGALRRRLAALCTRHASRPRARRAASAPPAAVPPPDVSRAAADAIVATVGE